ncbi:MAG: alanyl-tRNA editing protein [Candidatus Bathyarchaeota archaeon]|nr:MAG: alanyl-tRNA editing protein [Candidatus Bathyarchaeota archaeon]
MKLEDIIKGVKPTKLLYLENSYADAVKAEILRVVLVKKRGVYLILNETVFHPKSGGQPSDKGVFENPTFNITIKKAMILQGVIVHWGKIREGTPYETETHVKIEWNPRYLYMRRHTAGHLLDHCLKKITGQPVVTTDSWLGTPCYVGYEGKIPPIEEFNAALDLSNSLIKQGANVQIRVVSHSELTSKAPDAPNIYRLPHLQSYRTVTIEGCEPIPCAGTHVKNINEIKGVKVNSVEKTDTRFKVYYDVI